MSLDVDWSLKSLFGREVEKRCPVAQSSNINLKLPKGQFYDIQPNPSSWEENLAVFDLLNGE